MPAPGLELALFAWRGRIPGAAEGSAFFCPAAAVTAFAAMMEFTPGALPGRISREWTAVLPLSIALFTAAGRRDLDPVQRCRRLLRSFGDLLSLLGKIIGAELRLCFFYPYFQADDLRMMQRLYRRFRLNLVRHFHKPETPRPSGRQVGHNGNRADRSKRLKQFHQLFFRYRLRQITHQYVHTTPFDPTPSPAFEPPLHYTLIWDAPVLFISPPENNGHRFNAPGRPEGRAIKNFAAPRGPAKIRHFII
jgi:hypothetical protein